MEQANFSDSNPLVSVYMPTHNRGVLIARAIDSVLNQTYKNIELIICSDGSTDETVEVLQQYTEKDPRVSYVVNETSRGACFARNRCIELAKGDFITGLDDDDEFTEDRIKIFVDFHFSSKKDILTATRFYKNDAKINVGDIYQGDITSEMLGNANLIGNQVFTKTAYLRELGGFDINFPAWQDYDMWYRLVYRFGNCFKLSQPTYIFYVDENRPRITTGSRAYAGYRMFIEKHANTLSKEQHKSLFFQDLMNRGQAITLISLLNNFTVTNAKVYLKEKLKHIALIKLIYSLISKKRTFSKI
ncbi:glycosyltransferase [Rouxiella silvae]|uniref:glycosyltransferase n=1 Tax=Rouxiella silvae TaxID=1646373 RepID=UPI0039EFE7CC